MSKEYFSADFIFDGKGNQLNDKVLAFENDVLTDICRKDEVSAAVQHMNGALCPGFINAHCHLELSHLKSVIPPKTGLIEFLKSVVQLRSTDEEVILQRIEEEDRFMRDRGIVAVGDICNTSNASQTKKESKIRYYSFFEVFDLFMRDSAPGSWKNLKSTYDSGDGDKSIVPHAPYSVSKELWHLINGHLTSRDVISIHCQEMKEENDVHSTGSEAMDEFISFFGTSYPDYARGWKSSLDYVVNHLEHKGNVLFVHCTQSGREDFELMKSQAFVPFLVTCPNANLYIEDRLPDYEAWIDSGLPIAVGTDSLSSNYRLDILSELYTIQRNFSTIATDTLIGWACHNGAAALNMDDELGSFEVGKRPGLKLITHLDHSARLTEESRVKNLK